MRHPLLGPQATIAYVGAFPPDPGPAPLFTVDLANATDLCGCRSAIGAVTRSGNLGARWRDPRIAAVIVPDDAASYAAAAQTFCRAAVAVACILFEGDLFGGASGGHLPKLARALACPVVVVVRDVDPAPSARLRRAVGDLCRQAGAVVATTRAGAGALTAAYGVPHHLVRYIPLGAPLVDWSQESADRARTRLGLGARTVLTTLGPLDRRCGIAEALRAVAVLVRTRPDVLYLVASAADGDGAGIEESAERRSLERLAARLGITSHVRFVAASFVDLHTILDALAATDLYISPETPHPHATVLPSLAYAFASGAPIVATPTPYACELLGGRRGFFAPTGDPQNLAGRIAALLDDPAERAAARERACAHARGMTWESVGIKYVDLFGELVGAVTGAGLRYASGSAASVRR